MTRELTWLCDGETCEHECDVRHELGAGVFCAEHAAKRIRNSFDPDQEEEDQRRAREHARRTVNQFDEDEGDDEGDSDGE